MKKAERPLLPDLRDDALDACIDAAPSLVGLSVDAAYRDGVRQHLRATANAARLVLSSPLDDEAEPGPVFRA